jgi:hypothetical protein
MLKNVTTNKYYYPFLELYRKIEEDAIILPFKSGTNMNFLDIYLSPVIPIHFIVGQENEYGRYIIRKGYDKILTLVNFYENKFPLENMFFNKDLNGYFFKDLPGMLKSIFEDRQIELRTLFCAGDNDLFEQIMVKII